MKHLYFLEVCSQLVLRHFSQDFPQDLPIPGYHCQLLSNLSTFGNQ